jgi:hypothetical protein
MYCKPSKPTITGPGELADKISFVEELGILLRKYSGNDRIKRLRYRAVNNGEVVDIEMFGGTITVNITGDSPLAIMRDVTRALMI